MPCVYLLGGPQLLFHYLFCIYVFVICRVTYMHGYKSAPPTCLRMYVCSMLREEASASVVQDSGFRSTGYQSGRSCSEP